MMRMTEWHNIALIAGPELPNSSAYGVRPAMTWAALRCRGPGERCGISRNRSKHHHHQSSSRSGNSLDTSRRLHILPIVTS